MTDDARPAPLISADVVLRDLDYMPFDGRRAFNSDTWIECNAEEQVAALRLWWSSWHQEPAGSLPDNDRLLANLAGYGVAVETFMRVKPKAMRGWVLCSDGRLYHPVICEFAEKAWKTYRGNTAKREADRRRLQLKRGVSERQTAIVAATPSKSRSDIDDTSQRQTASVAATKGDCRSDISLNGREEKRREGSRALEPATAAMDAARERARVEGAGAGALEGSANEAGDALIAAFDDAHRAVVGQARPPAPADFVVASRLVKAGATPALVRHVAETLLRKQIDTGKRPSRFLAYVEDATLDALATPQARKSNGAVSAALRPLTAAQRRAKLEEWGLTTATREQINERVKAEGLLPVWRAK